MSKEMIYEDSIRNKIYSIRGVRVMLDRDLATLYGIETRVLKQAVKRNIKRFPFDFMFIINNSEVNFLVPQFVIPSKKHLGRAFPYVFTEQGVANLSSVLNSNKAIEINIKIMRAFVSIRKFLAQNADIFSRIDFVERKHIEYQIKTDDKIDKIFKLIEDKDIKPEKGIFYDGQILRTLIIL